MNAEMTDLRDTTNRPCTSFVPRSERDTTNCGACGWSRLGHERYAAELLEMVKGGDATGVLVVDDAVDGSITRVDAERLASAGLLVIDEIAGECRAWLSVTGRAKLWPEGRH
jgi:hypothetical protein